jgi:uncharacterized protein GlcG (DUF336 family)
MGTLSLAQANRLLSLALEESRRLGLKAMAVVVLDESGHVRAAQREDGASMFRTNIAIGKAWAAVSMGLSSRALGEHAKSLPHFFASLGPASGGTFIPHTGAVVIKDDDGQIVGSIGASGGSGDEDEAICVAAVRTAGLRHG